MAGFHISAILEQLSSMTVEKLCSFSAEKTEEESKLVADVYEEVKDLTRTFEAIQAVIEDAETRQVKEPDVKLWLSDLKDVSYDIQDRLEEWDTAIRVQGTEKEETRPVQHVPLLEKPSQVVLLRELDNKMRELKKRLEEIDHRKNRYVFRSEVFGREKSDVMAWKRSRFHSREGMEPMEDRQPSVSDATNAEGDHVSIDFPTDAPILDSATLEQISSENAGRRHRLRGKINREQIITMVNFLIEILSAAFEQLSSVHRPKYALIAMLMSFVAFLTCIIELAYKARTERVVWSWKSKLPWFYYPSSSEKPFGSVLEIIGLICAILQSISSVTVCTLYMQHTECPIKISLWPIAFAFCLLCSKFMSNPVLNNAFRED